MAILAIYNIRIPEHLADLQCQGGMKDDQPCSWSQADTNVNTYPQVKYVMDDMKEPPEADKNYITITCPNCGLSSTWPTFDPMNAPGYQLGQAKTS